MPEKERSNRRRWIYTVVGMVVGLSMWPLGVSASHNFTDVPDTNIFHADIEWLANARVTLGCNPPANDEFCPGETVTRQQMAAFMRRLATNKVVDAATAVDAEHADTAGDADTLDGLDSSDFFSTSGSTTVAIDKTTQGPYQAAVEIASASPVSTDAALYAITASMTGVHFNGGAPQGFTDVLVWAQIDVSQCGSPPPGVQAIRQTLTQSDPPKHQSIAVTYAKKVEAGSHKVSLCAKSVLGDEFLVDEVALMVVLSDSVDSRVIHN